MRRAIWALVVAVPLLGLLAFGFSHDPNAQASPLLGKPAPGFSLTSIDGHAVSLAAYRGKPVVVNFWASWCDGCRQEHQYLTAAWKRYASQGVVFLGVLFNDGPTAARGFMRKRGGAWLSLNDPDQQTAISYGVAQIPETFLIDRQGVVRYKSPGPILPGSAVTPGTFDQQLAHLLRRGRA